MGKQLSAGRLKVTCVLQPGEVLGVSAPSGQRLTLHIALPDRTLTADITGKSLRKAQNAIREHGVDGIAIVLQGHLVGQSIAEAGLVAQPRVKKEAPVPTEIVPGASSEAAPTAEPSLAERARAGLSGLKAAAVQRKASAA